METEKNGAIICVTGPMAAGKNTVSERFARRGYLVIDADEVVHNAIDKMSSAIIKEFKDEANKLGLMIARPDGRIDRRALGSILFRSPVLLSRQEAIVLPEVERETLMIISSSKNRRIVLNAVSLYKTPRLMTLCSLIIFVAAPMLVRLQRVRRRDGLPYKEIIKRFHSQRMLLAEYKKTGIPIAIVNNFACARRK